MSRNLLSVQLKNLISELDNDYQHHIRCALEIKKKIDVLRKAKEIADPKNHRLGLDGRVIERKKRELRFKQPLDTLLSSALKESCEFRSTREILLSMLLLDGQDAHLQSHSSYLQAVRRKLEHLAKRQIVVKMPASRKSIGIYWKLRG